MKIEGSKKKERIATNFAQCPVCEQSKAGAFMEVMSFAQNHALMHKRLSQRAPAQVAA